ncbi:hypothetical protein [Microcoleus sp. CAWBG58]|uniref:hypothetical protein n=1 Tax=Microcoleus sp. CAWBG58 TaxID=2841651 RepID=UPI0025FC33E2|nr:hypothetical protein [Microcoleus sp. CAWBG58]
MKIFTLELKPSYSDRTYSLHSQRTRKTILSAFIYQKELVESPPACSGEITIGLFIRLLAKVGNREQGTGERGNGGTGEQ